MNNFLEKIKQKREETKIRRAKRAEAKRLSCLKIEIEPFYASNYNNETFIDLITVAFNNPIIVDYQIRLFNKFIKGSFTQIICDNSNNEEKAKAIKEVCVKNNVTYINVTSGEKASGFSDSHGRALNRIYKNIVQKRQNNFAFLDHDILPIKEINIEDYLKHTDLFGAVMERGGIWYLWPGFAFYKYDYLKNKKLNFRRYRKFNFIKVEGADTGSGNWYPLYSKYDRSKFQKPDDILWNIRENRLANENEQEGNVVQESLVQYYLDKSWLHTMCASEWVDCKGKNQMIYEILDGFLK